MRPKRGNIDYSSRVPIWKQNSYSLKLDVSCLVKVLLFIIIILTRLMASDGPLWRYLTFWKKNDSDTACEI